MHGNELCGVFINLVKMTGLKFTPQARKEFYLNPNSFNFEKPFDETDLEEIGERVKV
jgi:hypothetical protein